MPLKAPILFIAEDDQDDKYFMESSFRRVIPEAQLFFFKNGKELLDKLNEGPELPRIIITDINMPVMDGKELLAILKKEPKYRKIPVIIFTTSDHRKDVEQCYSLGAASYIRKPATVENYDNLFQTMMEFWIGISVV